ncbi:alpha/beta fold hydrolase [Paracoccus sphaerophysae]|uniref:alpha/beta fold hydrolase n=1 Tax=Paracoccus sphaerophysae TaxID=690417 RepID=UPI002357E1E6|nr:alpha/beta hydrolase [Paracoccus sphaerophysae]
MTLFRRHFPGDRRRPALALHCMMGSGAGWGPIAEGLGGRVDLHALDLPGHGRSPRLAAIAPGEIMATTLTAARAEAKRLAAGSADHRVDLLGHSFGAVAALALAVEDPARVRSLTLIEPVMFAALPAPARDPDGLLAALEGFEAAGDRAGATAAFLRYWDGPDLDAVPPLTRDQLIAQMAAVLDTMAHIYHDRAGILVPGGLESLAAPVMFITGASSPPVIAEIAAALAARLPDVGRATVPGAGHMAPLTRPAAVAELIAVNLDRA